MRQARQNYIEKIAQKCAVDLSEGHIVHSGDYISISPAHVMSHDNTGAIIPKFRSIGVGRLANPEQVVITLDHNIQDTSAANLSKYEKVEAFAREMGAAFYPAGRGIGHQVMCEEGYIKPGTMVVASDSHSNMYGGLGCLGTPVVRTDAAAIWATGRTWWQIPPVARVVLEGTLRPGVSAKDVIVTLCGYFNNDEVLNHALEFSGDGVTSLSTDERLTIANMTTEWGALAAVFPPDEHVADEDAYYAADLTLDLSTVGPFVSGPDHVKTMQPAASMGHIKIDKAYLVSCVNSRVSDLSEAARVLRGKKVADGVEFYVAAASSRVQAESERLGDWQTILDSGATPLPPGCGPCIGLGEGLLEDGEVGISATNRNFKGRMGSRSARAYLASPAVVAASSVQGRIAAPFDVPPVEIVAGISAFEKPVEEDATISLVDGFPRSIVGDVILCPADNLNTDGIYPGKYTYVDDFSPAQQAGVVMENYDTSFAGLVKEGDILVGGFNFGTGSSREQAATALKHRGIRLVIAGSLSETYKRNALNNGFIALECPALTRDLRYRFSTDERTILTGEEIQVFFETSRIELAGKKYAFTPIGTPAQELIVAGGLEGWVKEQLEK